MNACEKVIGIAYYFIVFTSSTKVSNDNQHVLKNALLLN